MNNTHLQACKTFNSVIPRYPEETIHVLKYILVSVFFLLSFSGQTVPKKPATLQETLKACKSSVYHNTHTILRLLLIAPVTSATVERSNSSLRFVKNVYRSTMREERLNALLLLFIHKDIALDYAAIIDDYAKRNQRRMTFVNPLP